MKSDNNDVSRRTVLKKSATAATVAAGGLAVGSSSVAAADGGYLRAQGQGDFLIEVYADSWEVIENGVDLEISQSTDNGGNSYYTISGTVDGEINSTPDDYVQLKIYGQEKFDERIWDSGVDVYWKGDALSES